MNGNELTPEQLAVLQGDDQDIPLVKHVEYLLHDLDVITKKAENAEENSALVGLLNAKWALNIAKNHLT